MFGIAASEYLLIIIVAVLVLGPEHLPKVLRTLAKLVSNFRRITTEVQRVIHLESLEAESLLHTTRFQPLKKKKTKKTTTKKKQTSHTVKQPQEAISPSPVDTSQQETKATQPLIGQKEAEKKQEQNMNTSIQYHSRKKQEYSSKLSSSNESSSSSNFSESSDFISISNSRNIDACANTSLHDRKELS